MRALYARGLLEDREPSIVDRAWIRMLLRSFKFATPYQKLGLSYDAHRHSAGCVFLWLGSWDLGARYAVPANTPTVCSLFGYERDNAVLSYYIHSLPAQGKLSPCRTLRSSPQEGE